MAKAAPTISTSSLDCAALQCLVYVTLSGGSNPTGTIKAGLYGPSDSPDCTTTQLTSSDTVKGNGEYRLGVTQPR
jgi:hypothetical protein